MYTSVDRKGLVTVQGNDGSFRWRAAMEGESSSRLSFHLSQQNPNFAAATRHCDGGHETVDADGRQTQNRCDSFSLKTYSFPLRFLHPDLELYEVTMSRPSLIDKWGLSISLFDSAFLVVGWCMNSFQSRNSISNVGVSYSLSGVCPGDVVVSINEVPIVQLRTMENVVSSLNSSIDVSFVVLRLQMSLLVARNVLTTNREGQAAAEAASAAYRAGKDVFQRALRYPSLVFSKSNGDVRFHAMTPIVRETVGVWGGAEQLTLARNILNGATSVVDSETKVFPVVPSSSTLKGISDDSVPSYHLQLGRGMPNSCPRNKLVFPSPKCAPCTVDQNFTRDHQALRSVQPTVGSTSMLKNRRTGDGNELETSNAARNTPSSYFCFDELIGIMDPDKDGTRARQFMDPFISNDFSSWLSHRKCSWRTKWNICRFDMCTDREDEEEDNGDLTGSELLKEFWLAGGYSSFEHWLSERTNMWKKLYSWNVKKRKRLEIESEEIVSLPFDLNDDGYNDKFQKWLRVRRYQWKIMRRKRQRRIEEDGFNSRYAERSIPSLTPSKSALFEVTNAKSGSLGSACPGPQHLMSRKKKVCRSTSDLKHIDALLEEQEQRQKQLDDRPPLDISFIFDANVGAPDDVVAYCLNFLPRSEHGKLMCISWSTSVAIKDRADLWRNLCPTHWILPKRPRKPFYHLYISKLYEEEEETSKRSDEVVTRVVNIMEQADHLNKVEKLVNRAEKKFGFSVNYVSGVVLERNSILNMAVIYKRHRIVKWLVECKNADVETFDRGNFTPLLNAAWAGDKYLVRFLLSKGADRTKIGTGHYTQKLASPDFEGLNAEGWARKKGHRELAELINIGLA